MLTRRRHGRIALAGWRRFSLALLVRVGLAALLPLLALGCGSARTGASRTSSVTVAAAVGGGASAPSFPDLVAHVRSGVVRIEAATCDGEAIGTGFLLGPRTVATVEHVVDGATAIRVKRNGVVLGSATVVGADKARDLALLRVSRPVAGHVFRLAPRAPQLGESVAAFGFPLGLPLTVTRGSVSGLDRAIEIGGFTRRRLVQTDAAVNPGNSGGPLLSTDTGEVVGLVDLGTNQANGLAFAVSALVARPLLQAWTAAPEAVAATSCAAPAPTPATVAPPPNGSTSPPAGSGGTDAQQVADAIYGYWDAIQNGDYQTAFAYLSPAEGQQLGGAQTFVSQHQADPVESVAVQVAVTSVGSATATADVLRLQTVAASTGCRDWSGNYTLVRQAGEWFIASASLNFTAC